MFDWIKNNKVLVWRAWVGSLLLSLFLAQINQDAFFVLVCVFHFITSAIIVSEIDKEHFVARSLCLFGLLGLVLFSVNGLHKCSGGIVEAVSGDALITYQRMYEEVLKVPLAWILFNSGEGVARPEFFPGFLFLGSIAFLILVCFIFRDIPKVFWKMEMHGALKGGWILIWTMFWVWIGGIVLLHNPAWPVVLIQLVRS